jgi:hypothetical protein
VAQTRRCSSATLISLFGMAEFFTGLAPLRSWADPPVGAGRFLDIPDVLAMNPEVDTFSGPLNPPGLLPGFWPYPIDQAIVSISPTVGSTYRQVVIRSQHRFQSPSAVSFGALPAASFFQQADGSIVAYTPVNGVHGTSVVVSVTDRGGTFSSNQRYSYPIARMEVTGPLPFSPSAIVDTGWDKGRGRSIVALAPATLSFVVPPELHVSTSFFDDTEANPPTYQGTDWAVGTYATFKAVLQMCDLSGTPPAGDGACTNFDGNRGTWIDQVQADGRVDRAGDNVASFGDLVLPTAPLFDDENLVRTFRLRLSLQQHDAVVHEKAYRIDWEVTAPFNAVIAPTAFIQVRAIPYTIIYQPPGNLSTGLFQTSTTYSNTFRLGSSNEQSNNEDFLKSNQLKISISESLSIPVGDKGIGVFGGGDFGEKWDEKTTNLFTTARETNQTIATSLGFSKSYGLPALQTTIPGSGDTCTRPQFQAPAILAPYLYHNAQPREVRLHRRPVRT